MKQARATQRRIDFQERAACALCGSRVSEIHRAFRDIPVVRCGFCGFLYSQRIMDGDAMRNYYRDGFGSQRHLEGQRVNASSNAAVLSRLLNLRQVKNWLDVGTGYGFLLKWLQETYGIAAEGVELSEQEADFACHELGVEVHPTHLAQSRLRPEHYDVVSSFETIEHIPDPVKFVTEMAEYVRPGGALVLMTDNFESRTVKALGGSFPKWIPHTHVSHFAPKSLRSCIGKTPGLKIEAEGSFSPWDMVGRQWLAQFRSAVPDEKAYDLAAALSVEMKGTYKLFRLRSLLNPLWARLALRKKLDHGSLMYAVCRKAPASAAHA